MSWLESYFGSPNYREFDNDEAATLKQQAKQMKQRARSTKKGFKALGDIVGSQVDMHSAWRKFQVTHARGETKKAIADGKAFKAMGLLADKHAKAKFEAEEANSKALEAVSQYANKYKQEAQLFGFRLW